MKTQWSLVLGLVFAIIVAIFASLNVSEVSVNYLFGKAYWPLILIILGSALAGVFISACFAAVRTISYRKKVGQLEKEQRELGKLLAEKDQQLEEKEAELTLLKLTITDKEDVEVVNEDEEDTGSNR
ncbi:lipopolysaccharide assembly protein LapA domain-containing protein [Solibacillus sp. CAU 1738]|uniref:LapA family protein n=1 Tax=Solibacillus sp. CAU 1738 TaxID=3140363 RepID=UPI00326031D0